MKRIAVLLDNVVQFIYTSEEILGYVSPFVEVDVTEYQGDVGDYYVYDVETKTFAKGEIPQPEPEPTPEPIPTAEEVQLQTLLNTEYLIALSKTGI